MIRNEVHYWYEFVICHQCISLFLMKYMFKYGFERKLFRDFLPVSQSDFDFNHQRPESIVLYPAYSNFFFGSPFLGPKNIGFVFLNSFCGSCFFKLSSERPSDSSSDFDKGSLNKKLIHTCTR